MLKLIRLTLGAGVLLAIIAGSAFAGAALAQTWREAPAALAAVPDQAQPAEDEGVLIVAVAADSPAAAAGLRRGDIVLTAADQAVNTVPDLRRALAAAGPVAVTYQHGDDRRTATLAAGADLRGLVPFSGDLVFGAVHAFGWPAEGAHILEVIDASAADQAGLSAGDLILEVDGAALSPANDLGEMIQRFQPGAVITLKVQTPGAEARTVTATLGQHPDDASRAFLGVRVAPVFSVTVDGQPFSGDLLPWAEPLPGEVFTFPEGADNGLFVGGVAADGPAAAAGVKSGDQITAVDGAPVTGLETLTEAVAARQPGEALPLTLQRGEETLTVTVILGAEPGRADRADLGITALGYVSRTVTPEAGWPPADWPFVEPELPPFFEPAPGTDI